MNYEEAVEYIHSVTWVGRKTGLQRMEELLRRMGNPQKELKFVHVAGTNGKGSVCAMLASVLREAGYRTGQFTSPYIHVFNERIQVNDKMISNQELAEIVEYIKPLADAMSSRPSIFDLITAVGMEYFKRQNCHIVVLEAGIGGRLDSTNVIGRPEAAVITSIGFDHRELLGTSISEIAREKAGIIKENTDVIFQGRNEEAGRAVEEACREKHASLSIPDYSRLREKEFYLEGQSFDYKDYKDLRIPLLGRYQLENASIAITALEVLAKKGFLIKEKHIRKGLSKVRWEGRFQLLSKEPAFLVDGAHNPPGIHAAAESIKMYFPNKKIIFIIGIMKEKELDKMAGEVLPLAKEFLTVRPDSERALAAEDLAAYLEQEGAKAEAFGSVKEACQEAARRAGKDGVICALGSLYLVDEVSRSVKQV